MSDKVIVSKAEILERLNQLHACNYLSQYAADNLYALLDQAQPAPVASEPDYLTDDYNSPAYPASNVNSWKYENKSRMTLPLYKKPQPAIPEGYQLVPIEPTEEMIEAGNKAFMCGSSVDLIQRTYKAMIAAKKEGV